MKRTLPFLIIVAVLGLALGSVWYLTKPSSTSPSPASQPTPSAAAQNPAPTRPAQGTLGPFRAGIPGAEPANTKGPANAPVQLEEFGDFECPPCGMFHPVLEEMVAEFPKELRVTFRHFPLPNHQHALRAASSAEAAGLQGKFWQMHKLLYEHQKEWKEAFDVKSVFDGYAAQIGLDVDRFNRDVGSAQVQQRVVMDSRRGQSMGVNGTPTVFLNGREIPFESLPAETLRVLIQKEIDSKK